MCLKTAGLVTNRVDPDQMPHSVASDLGLHCLFMHVCLNTWGKYNIFHLQFTNKVTTELLHLISPHQVFLPISPLSVVIHKHIYISTLQNFSSFFFHLLGSRYCSCLFEGLTSLSTSFTHAMTVSWCEAIKGHQVPHLMPFYSATLLQYHAQDTLTWHYHRSHYTDTSAKQS